MSSVLAWLLGPHQPTIGDLARIAHGRSEEADNRLHELLDWRMQRAMTVVKGTIGTAATFVITLLVAQFKKELDVDAAWLYTAVGGAVFIALFGLYTLRRLAAAGTEYVHLLYLLYLLRLPR